MNNHGTVLCLLLLCLNFTVHAQRDNNNEGIYFENGLSWEAITAKAKKENKYIFVDCYTTWCTPCKHMEKEIYPLKKVGDYFNQHFISVKLQMDKKPNDPDDIKASYKMAKFIQDKYQVVAYPTYLFFQPDGRVVHRGVGGFPSKMFIELAQNAFDTNKQYYTLLANYKPQQMDTAQLKVMALQYKSEGPELASIIVREYMSRLAENDRWNDENLSFLRQFFGLEAVKSIAAEFLNKTKETELLTPARVEFIDWFTNNSTDKGFALSYKYPALLDSLTNKLRFHWNRVNFIIYQENVEPVLSKAIAEHKTPDWGELVRIVEQKYSHEYALVAVMSAKINWFDQQKDKSAYHESIVNYLDTFTGKEQDQSLNNFAWLFFLEVDNKDQLLKALQWSRESIDVNPNPNFIDTYANLLYKLGRKNEAIRWQQLAVKSASNDKGFQDNLKKMKAGQPTWTASK
jgi:thioredoxin-related protein